MTVALTGGRIAGAPLPLTYFIADGRGRPGFRPSDPELARWALQAWQRSASNGLRLDPAEEQEALIRLYWTESNDGRYGEMRPLKVRGRDGAAVFIQPDVTLLGDDIARRAAADDLFRDSIVYLTCLHELGHALGLAHTRDFRRHHVLLRIRGRYRADFGRYRDKIRARADIAGVSGLSEADVQRLRTIYP